MPAAMLPHVPTLVLSTVIVTGLLGLLLLCTWLQDRSHRALLWWGPAYLLAAFGTALLGSRGAIPDFLSFEVANAAVLFAAGSIWAGARCFEGRSTPFGLICVAPAAWVVACQFAFFADNLGLRVVVASSTIATFVFLAAYEFWRARAERLVSRWPAIVIMTMYGMVMLIRIATIQFVDLPPAMELFRSNWFGFTSLGTLIFFTTTAFILLAMTKERAEAVHRRAALVDPLTGLLNRRAFLAEGDACLARTGQARRPVAALIFDLDRFKQINDRFGHQAGDRILQVFSEAVVAELRSSDLVGRIGGEEFAAVLPGCVEEQALEAAERVRATFAHAAGRAGRDYFGATVSVGVASLDAGHGLTVLLAAADRAVYRAKAAGRNCVRTADAAAAHEAPASGVERMPEPRAGSIAA